MVKMCNVKRSRSWRHDATQYGFKKLAVVDGCRDYAEIHLYYVNEDDEIVSELQWGDDWPDWVSTEFLELRNYEVISACRVLICLKLKI